MTDADRVDAYISSVRLREDPAYRMKRATWGLLMAIVEYEDACRDLEDAL